MVSIESCVKKAESKVGGLFIERHALDLLRGHMRGLARVDRADPFALRGNQPLLFCLAHLPDSTCLDLCGYHTAPLPLLRHSVHTCSLDIDCTGLLSLSQCVSEQGSDIGKYRSTGIWQRLGVPLAIFGTLESGQLRTTWQGAA